MSLLLDALRKSEQRRQDGAPPPLGLSAGPAAGDRRSAPEAGGGWRLLLLLIAAVIAVSAWWVLGRSSDAIEQPLTPSAPVESVTATTERSLRAEPYRRPARLADAAPAGEPESDRADASRTMASAPADATDPAVETAVAETPPEPADSATRASLQPPSPEPVPPPERPDSDFEAETDVALPETGPRAARSTDSDRVDALRRVDGGAAEAEVRVPNDSRGSARAEPAVDPRANTIDPWDLPASLRGEFPDVDLAVHVYADDPQARFVLIGGERFGEGDAVAEGVQLSEILRGGVIVEFRDYRIWIE